VIETLYAVATSGAWDDNLNLALLMKDNLVPRVRQMSTTRFGRDTSA
jgi:hypothetical protein